jgi:glycosyltransferase 2 family protein
MHPLIRVGIRLGVAAAVLALLFRFVPFAPVAAALTDLHMGWVVAGVLLQYVLRVVGAVRMRPITSSQSIDLSHWALFRILLAAQFYSMLLPGPLAGGGATWLKYVQHGASRQGAAVAIVLNRAIGLMVMITLGAAALLADPRGPFPGLAAIVLIGGGAALVAANVRWSGAPGAPDSAERSRVRRAVSSFRERLLLFGAMRARDKVVVVVGSVAFEIVGAAVMWCFARAGGIDVSLLTVMWIRTALQIVLVLPVTVAGLGIREVGLVGVGALIGIPAAAAVTWSLTIFFGALIVAASGGLVESTWLGNRMTRTPDPATGPPSITAEGPVK